jgi:hypothetical protein
VSTRFADASIRRKLMVVMAFTTITALLVAAVTFGANEVFSFRRTLAQKLPPSPTSSAGTARPHWPSATGPLRRTSSARSMPSPASRLASCSTPTAASSPPT